jgi:membrane protein DedA with SNARE-associated domain
MLRSSIVALLASAGHSPILQATAIVLATFVLEDAATVIAAMEAHQGHISVPLALASLFVGIVLGDLGLYGLGRAAIRLQWIGRMLPPRRQAAVRAWLSGRVFRVVFVSRFVPGLRLPTYTTCGFLGADLRRFILAAVIATSLWTSLLFGVSMQVGHLLIDHLGAWRWAGTVGFVIFVILAGRLAASRVQSQCR